MFITAFTEAQVALALTGIDAPRMLCKPFDPTVLAAEIEALA